MNNSSFWISGLSAAAEKDANLEDLVRRYVRLFQYHKLSKVLTQTAYTAAKDDMQYLLKDVPAHRYPDKVAKAIAAEDNESAAAKQEKKNGLKRRLAAGGDVVPVDEEFGKGKQKDDGYDCTDDYELYGCTVVGADDYEVYVETDVIAYDCMLNKADVGDNKNRFYLMQLLVPKDDVGAVLVWMRWGRVGVVAAARLRTS